MNTAQMKEAKYITAGYAILALMYLAMATMLLGADGWGGLEQAMQNIDIIGGTLLLILGLFFLNLLLALGSWRVLTFSLLYRRLFLSAAIVVAVVVVINNIPGWWRWYQGTLPPGYRPSGSRRRHTGCVGLCITRL
jgi:membrane protease YdiL (CAAX protease family)